jgi:hypothetical protein
MPSAFDPEDHIFRSPTFENIVNEAIVFFNSTPVQPLPRSIDHAKNLNLADIVCRFIILNDEMSDLIVTVESTLIRRYTPLWNAIIDGFGNHDPGKGRRDQAISEWDVLHPGRPWIKRMTGPRPDLEEVLAKIEAYTPRAS